MAAPAPAPERAPNRLETLRALRAANADGALSGAFSTLVTGGFLVGFVKLLGGSDLWLGALTALPSAVGLLQIPGAVLGRRFVSRKGYVLPGGLLWRLFYVPVAVLPLVALAAGIKLAILLGCVTLAAISATLINPTYSEWLAELVPANSRGTFFSTRNALGTAVGTAGGMGGALLLDAFRKRHHEALGFSVIFGLGLACAALSMAAFMRTHDVPRERAERQDLRAVFRAFGGPFRDREFRRVLLFLGLFVFGQGFAGNLFSAYALESLGFSFSALQGLTVMQAAGNILASRGWGFLADKYGNKPCLGLAGAGIVLTPAVWLFTRPSDPGFSLALLLVVHFFMGFAWSGVALCQFNLLLSTSRSDDRASYIASGMATQSVLGGISPLLGASLMASLRSGLPPEAAYKIVFGATMACRLFGILFLIPVRELGSTGLRTTLRHIAAVTPTGFRAMRSLGRSGDETEREASILKLGEASHALAADDLIAALHDPSPRVRRGAAVALGRLGDPKAVGELVHQLDEHPDLVEEETVSALGEIGDAAAIPVLVRFLSHPRSMLRRAAARALARIPASAGDPAAREALLQAAAGPNDPDARRGALQALRELGDEAEGIEGLGPVLAASLLEPHPSVRIAASEAAAELHRRDLAPALRESLARYRDEAGAEVAYALGAVGEEGDLPAILDFAAECGSMTTRRRSLLGAARLLGVEREAYRLLLTEGMARDRALLAVLGGSRPGSAEAAALERYSLGDERGAMARLPLSEAASALRRCSAPETFLVAACVYGKENPSRATLLGRG